MCFGEVYTTDGRIPDLDLTVVEDGGAFILYNVSMTLTDEAFNQAPDQLTEIADKLLENLDADTMAELNRQVDVEGKSLAAVAKGVSNSEPEKCFLSGRMPERSSGEWFAAVSNWAAV